MLLAFTALPASACLAQSAPTLIEGRLQAYELRPPSQVASGIHWVWELKPVSDVRVYATTAGGTLDTISDRDGRFRLWNVDPGNVQLSFTKTGYVSMFGRLCLAPGSIRNLDLGMSRGGGSAGFMASVIAAHRMARPEMVDTPGATTFLKCEVPTNYPVPRAPIGAMPFEQL